MLASTNAPFRLVFASPYFDELAGSLPAANDLTRREAGARVTDRRSSWVRRVRLDKDVIYVKSYDYRTCRDRLGNWMKWTAPWRASRAARECAAFKWLTQNAFPAPRHYACIEWRVAGFARRATLITSEIRGVPADQALEKAKGPARRTVASQLGRFIGDLHRAGFRDRNLDLRNLIIDGDDVVKIDSPRHLIVPPNRADDWHARADWRRLRPQLAKFGVDEVALAAR